MSDDNQIPSVPLTGRELLDKIRQLNNLPRQEIAKLCGYFTITSSGQERVNLTGFYNTVLDAKKDIPDRELNLEAEKHFTRPWSKRRGIESIDRNDCLILTRSQLEEFAAVVAKLAIEWQPDVMGKEIRYSSSGLFAFQLVGQNWSILTPVYYLSRKDLAWISKQLKQPLIYLTMSDSASEIGYELYESGILVETFAANDDLMYKNPDRLDSDTQIFEFYPYPEDPEVQQVAYFWSIRRKVTVEDIHDGWHFTNELLLEYEAYDPAIDCNYFLPKRDRSGYYLGDDLKIYRVQNPGHTLVIDGSRQVTAIPEFVRVDYFIFDRP